VSFKLLVRIFIIYLKRLRNSLSRNVAHLSLNSRVMDDFIIQVTQLLRAELEELVDVARATFEDIELCDEEW